MRHLPAFFACAVFVAAWVYAFTIRPDPSFTVLAFDEAGEAHVLGTGLSEAQCMSAAARLPARYEAVYCEPEG